MITCDLTPFTTLAIRVKFKVCDLLVKIRCCKIDSAIFTEFSSAAYPCITNNIDRLQGVPGVPHVAILMLLLIYR